METNEERFKRIRELIESNPNITLEDIPEEDNAWWDSLTPDVKIRLVLPTAMKYDV